MKDNPGRADALRSDQEGLRARAAPFAATCDGRHPERGRLQQAVHRHRQLVHRHRAGPRAPERLRRGGAAGRARGGRRAVHVPHHRRGRRHRDGPPRHEVQPRQPRADRRLGGDDGLGAPLRRHDLHPQLRQDRARHVDGRHALERADDLRQRRADEGGRHAGWPGRRSDVGVRGGGRVSGRQDRRREPGRAGSVRLPDVRLLLRHVHRQLDELPLRGAGDGAARQRHDPGRRSAGARSWPSGLRASS